MSGLLLACGVMMLGGQPPQRPVRELFVATSGDDANGGTPDRPFRTIQKGVDALRPGDTLTIRGGTYAEHVKLTVSGSYFNRDIRIQAASGEEVILDGTDKASKAVFDTNGADHVIIRGLRIRNGGFCGLGVYGSWRVRVEDVKTLNSPGSGIIVDKGHDVRVSGCEVERACQRGGEESISVKRSTDVVIEKTEVHHTKHEGIDIKEGSKHVVVRDCYVHHVERQGLYADAWDAETYDIRFDRNRVHDCMVGLVACTESGGLLRDVWFTNNLIYDCKGPGMLVAKWGSERMTHRIQDVYYLNNTVVNCGNGGQGANWGGGMLLENDQAENVVVMNNILVNSPQKQLQKDHLKLIPKGFTVRNNLIFGPTERFGTGNVYQAPRFVDVEKKDFRLAAGSLGVDQGHGHAGVGEKDVAGRSRIQGKRIDIGAYETP